MPLVRRTNYRQRKNQNQQLKTQLSQLQAENSLLKRERDDFQSPEPNRTPWIICGSVIGGIVIITLLKKIFRNKKRRID